MVGPAAKREGVAHLQAELGLSEPRACLIVNADRKMVRYRSRRPPETVLRTQMREPRQCTQALRLPLAVRAAPARQTIGHQPDLPALSALSGGKPYRTQTARSAPRCRARAPILVEAEPNASWSLDFVHDQFAYRRQFRILNIVEDVTRECLAAIPDTPISMP